MPKSTQEKLADLDREVEGIERSKGLLISKYLHMQDIVDGYNEKIYQVCCDIEAINLKLQRARAEQKRLSASPDSSRVSSVPPSAAS